MAKPRNTTTQRLCPDCQGNGCIDVAAHNPQLDTIKDCPNRDCEGGWVRWAPRDPLESLKWLRQFHRYPGSGLALKYASVRRLAMLPATLPPDGRAYYEAVRDADSAIRNFRVLNSMFATALRQRAA